ncbi:MAG: phospho-N-acetylmuramoyl-pentapeptide-transferase, partial [Rikenellaceae bacterium]|nr:phospho-N-acetylmuramoyl-pentapeptide-transferase [Rikenellaceae bacterium]
MLYSLFEYLGDAFSLPGAGMFQYLSFRAAMAIITALLIAIVFGRKIIDRLARLQIGEEIRNLGLEGQMQKKGTPTMGGIIILLAILVPMLLFCDLTNIYIQLMLVSTIWLGLIGGADDYIKVFRHNKEGLKGRFKIVGQVGLGVIVGTTMWLNADIVVRDNANLPSEVRSEVVEQNYFAAETGAIAETTVVEDIKTTQTTIPFIKDNEFDYKWLTGGNETLGWLVYVLVAIFVITAVSNGANLTDGLDGLVTGVSAPIAVVLGVLAYLSGHIVYADY